MSEPENEMNRDEYLRASFFSPDVTSANKRRSRRTPPDILALRRFVKAIENTGRGAQEAAVIYLVDRYLGHSMANFIRRQR